jgi:hypothetical protein
MIEQIKNIQEQVQVMLENYPKLRDNDNRLFMSLILMLDKELKDQSVKEFTKKFITGRYPAMESVTRARRKVQEEFPHLRGESYINRQLNAENVKNGINK